MKNKLATEQADNMNTNIVFTLMNVLTKKNYIYQHQFYELQHVYEDPSTLLQRNKDLYMIGFHHTNIEDVITKGILDGKLKDALCVIIYYNVGCIIINERDADAMDVIDGKAKKVKSMNTIIKFVINHDKEIISKLAPCIMIDGNRNIKISKEGYGTPYGVKYLGHDPCEIPLGAWETLRPLLFFNNDVASYYSEYCFMGIISAFFFEGSEMVCFLVNTQYYYHLSPSTTNIHMDSCYGHAPETTQDIINKMIELDSIIVRPPIESEDEYAFRNWAEVNDHVITSDLCLFLLVQYVGKTKSKWIRYDFTNMVMEQDPELLHKFLVVGEFVIVFLGEEAHFEKLAQIVRKSNIFALHGEINFLTPYCFDKKRDTVMAFIQKIHDETEKERAIALSKEIEFETMLIKCNQLHPVYYQYHKYVMANIKRIGWTLDLVKFWRTKTRRIYSSVLAATKYVIAGLIRDGAEVDYPPIVYCMCVVQHFGQKTKLKSITNMCSKIYDTFMNDFVSKRKDIEYTRLCPFPKRIYDDVVPFEIVRNTVDKYLNESENSYMFEMQMDCVLLMFCSRYSRNGKFQDMPSDVIRFIGKLIFFN